MNHRIDFHDPYFFVYCRPSTRHIPKSLGLTWSPSVQGWKTGDPFLINEIITRYRAQAIVVDLTADAVRALDQWKQRSTYGERIESDYDPPVPEGLSLLPYQRAGIEAMRSMPSGCLLADEMGLGKTVQAVVFANTFRDLSKVLIIVPSTLKLNWKREWEKWSIHSLPVGLVNAGKPFPDTSVVIINYDLVEKYRRHLEAQQWDILICDEAHYLKNPKAQRTQAVLGGGSKRYTPLHARYTLFLTGTPILNRPIELWPIVRRLAPYGLGADWQFFVTRYCNGHRTRFGWDVQGASNLDELSQRLKPYMVRRYKNAVLRDLPEKRRVTIPLEVGTVAKPLIKQEHDAFETFRQIEIELQAFRETPSPQTTDSREKYRQLEQAYHAAFQELSRLRHDIAVTKVPDVVQFVRDSDVEKVVIMAWHRDVAELIAQAFLPNAVCVHGGVPPEQRDAAIHTFQSDPTCRVFVGTMSTCGQGITLTASDTVVFAELAWSPPIIQQAEDRVHRIGQHHPVSVYFVVYDGSIDARIAQVLATKQKTIEQVLGSSSPSSGSILPDTDAPPLHPGESEDPPDSGLPSDEEPPLRDKDAAPSSSSNRVQNRSR